MPAHAWSTLVGRWRAFADAVAIVLGINVWVSVVLLPSIYVGALKSPGSVVIACLPLPMIAFGVLRRSELFLLLVFPLMLLVPVALSPAIASAQVYGPIRFTIVAIGLVAYLFGASFFTSFHEPPAPENTRDLASSRQATPERWRRRFRVYRWLALLSIVFPIVLLYKVNFDGENRADMIDMYPLRLNAMTTLLNLGVIGGWLLLYLSMFLGILVPHRTGDRDLAVDLAQARKEIKRGRPRPLFYVGVAAALGFMVLLMLLRYF